MGPRKLASSEYKEQGKKKEKKEEKKLVSGSLDDKPDKPAAHDYECPITHEIMQDPVVAADGHSYERAAIQERLEKSDLVSPVTSEKLTNATLIPNHALKKAIQKFLQQRSDNDKEKKTGSLNQVKSAAQQKHHPGSEVAGTLLELTAVEAALGQERQITAANKIKRFYLTYRKKGLKAFFKTPHLHKQQAALSQELKQSIEKEQKQQEQFKASLKAQEGKWAEEQKISKARHEENIKQAAASGDWGQIQKIAQKAAEEEKAMQGSHDKAKQDLLAAQAKKESNQAKKQSKLRRELKQVEQAKLDKYSAVLEQVNPILAMDKAVRTSEREQAVLMDGQAKLAGALKEKIEAARLKAGFFNKPETKQAEKKLDAKAIGQVLRQVAYGEQDEAEALLKKEPYLALEYGAVTDPGGRTFKKVTAFQYAVWSLDWHMWEMMLRCFKEEHVSVAAGQYKELDEKGTEHGKQFSLDPLIEALKIYNEEYDGWTDEQRDYHWQKLIAGEQAKLAMHVVNEYCRTDRSFEKREGMFQEKTLPRGKGREAEWLHLDNEKNEGGEYKYTLGGAGGVRAGYSRMLPSSQTILMKKHNNFPSFIQTFLTHQSLEADIRALSLLSTTRHQKKSELAQKLAPKKGPALTHSSGGP